jgi:hypothetical protein
MVLILASVLAGEVDLERMAHLVVRQTNEFRQQHDLPPVKDNRQLRKAAEYFAAYLAREDQLDHEADGKTPAERAEEYGYEYCIVLENIASQSDERGRDSQRLAQSLLAAWQSSPRHRENLLDPDVTETGMAVAHNEDSGLYYAVQMFGRPRSEQAKFTVINEAEAEVKYEVDDSEFFLSSRVTRTHGYCRAAQLIVHLDDDRTESLTPKNGEHIAIVKKHGELAVERR